MSEEILLPYRTDWREMRAVLDYCKGKGADRGALEARFGAGESLRETLNALEQLRLIERGEGGDARLTPAGDALVWAPDQEGMRARLIDALVAFPPYRYPLERAAADAMEVLDGPWVEHIWQVDMRLGQPRNRVEEARTFFFRLADEAGLGSYRRGVRGQTTRLDLADDFTARVRPALERLAAPSDEPQSPAEQRAAEPVAAPTAVPSLAIPAQPPALTITPPNPGSASGVSAMPTTFTLHVDMSAWDLDRIEAFLRMIGYPLPADAEA